MLPSVLQPMKVTLMALVGVGGSLYQEDLQVRSKVETRVLEVQGEGKDRAH